MAGSRTADGVEMDRGPRAEDGAEGGSEGVKEGWTESGTEGCKGAMGGAAAGRVGAGGGTESGKEGCNEGDKWVMGAAATGRVGTVDCSESGIEGFKEGCMGAMAAAAVGRTGAEGGWSGPGGAIVVPAVVRGSPSAAAGATRACGASRVSNSREQASPGRNAQRAAPSEHRLRLEAAGATGGRAMERAVLRARTESPHGWQQDGPWRGVPARLSRYPATGSGRQPALGSWPIPRAGSGCALSGSWLRSAQGFGLRPR